MIKKIGFIGLGTVGKHMAANLLKGDCALSVYDRNAASVDELVRAGAAAADSPQAAAAGRDMVIVILPEQEEMAAARAGNDGFLNGLDPGTLLVDMGTHSLEATQDLAREAAERKLAFLEAPVWGTREHAVGGLLTVLVGGDPAALSRCREAFSFFALNIIHVGEVGDATRMKSVINLVQAEVMEALAEGLVLGDRLGFPAEKVLEVLDSGGVSSPLFHAKGRAIARGDFSRNLALKYVCEGLQQVRAMGAGKGDGLPAAEAVRGVYERAVREGRGEEDFSAIVKVLRQ